MTDSPDDPWDTLRRQVLFAVELVDPVTLAHVSEPGLKVRAKNLDVEPYAAPSGRFIWFGGGQLSLGAITIDPRGLPYHPERLAPPAPAADPGVQRLDERLARVDLRPTAAYPFADGVTAIRGRLVETGDPGAPPLPKARVQLAWHDLDGDKWVPAPPGPEDVDDGDESPTPREPQTDARGEFAVFARVATLPPADPDINGGLLKVRLQFTQGRRNPVTRVTPDEYPFLDGGGPLPPPRRGRVHEGRLLDRALGLAWSDLQAV